MARIFRIWIDLFPPSELRPDYCVECFEVVRTARPHRILHFGLKDHPTAKDMDWVEEVISAEIRALVHRTVGIQGTLLS